jgi:hypothetical protein
MDATLAQLAEQLDEFLVDTRNDERWRAEAADQIRVFRAAWVRYHSSSDLTGGLLHDLTEADPRVTPLVRRLRSESLRLIECCDFALSALRRPDASPGEMRHALREVVAQARHYRSRAATATYESLSVDLGSG